MEASAKMGSNLVFCQFARRPLDKHRFRPFGDSQGIYRVRNPKPSFKFSIGMARRDPE
jgi:hypothetical protein